ncbi:MAG: type II toxin-antitoxin system RelE/ParE family toxin [Spirochaetia bacterium]|jgi:mRNA interferase RelE/StbE|nr:type II toxin-antitoxin system RelE/ParE family toxin [Spirochaetia bacterium]
MAEYKIFFKKSVWKDFKAIPNKHVKKILERIDLLIKDPRPIDCKKLTNQEKYRLRQGEYRILYSIKDKELTIWVVKVGHRRNVYH